MHHGPCRSELEGDAPAEEESGRDIMAAFKVAAFEFAEPNAAPTAALPSGPASRQDAESFWKGLLGQGFSDLELARMAELGKGRRERKQARPSLLVLDPTVTPMPGVRLGWPAGLGVHRPRARAGAWWARAQAGKLPFSSSNHDLSHYPNLSYSAIPDTSLRHVQFCLVKIRNCKCRQVPAQIRAGGHWLCSSLC